MCIRDSVKTAQKEGLSPDDFAQFSSDLFLNDEMTFEKGVRQKGLQYTLMNSIVANDGVRMTDEMAEAFAPVLNELRLALNNGSTPLEHNALRTTAYEVEQIMAEQTTGMTLEEVQSASNEIGSALVGGTAKAMKSAIWAELQSQLSPGTFAALARSESDFLGLQKDYDKTAQAELGAHIVVDANMNMILDEGDLLGRLEGGGIDIRALSDEEVQVLRTAEEKLKNQN